ncbi:MAG TPA: COX15/CtaA family protein [Opitutaceae bacterium]|jgi:cytochrome c oxidase assembly protein subunit 15|nr:COX15/CtaA family protein [Opitutaceae bacterium]
MNASIASARTPAYKPGIAWLAVASIIWAGVLICLGAFTTSIGAGMAFPDWPLSNGSLNPTGWLHNLSMFAEHSHRLTAGVMSLITIALALWLWRRESRAWLRKLALFAVGLVFAQAVVGGLRVLLDHWQVAMVDTSVGRLFAMLHACLAQGFLCVLVAIALACSRAWLDEKPSTAFPAGTRRIGVICCALLFMQLAIAAVMRHSFAGLAIPTFPWSSPDHALLPPVWSFRIGLNFAHRVMAGIITVALVILAGKIWAARSATAPIRNVTGGLMSLLALQIYLGASVIWTGRAPFFTTAHVIVGAATLATTFGLTWWMHRDIFAEIPKPATSVPHAQELAKT